MNHSEVPRPVTNDGKGRLQIIRAWAPVAVWVIIVLLLGTTPGLFQRYHALLKPLLQPGKSSQPASPRSTQPVAPPSSQTETKSPAPSLTGTLKSLAKSIWLRVRPLAARVLLSSAIMERAGHFLMYMVLGLLTARAQAIAPIKSGLAALLGAAAALAAFDEALQRWVPLRSSSVDDWMVDIAGASVGIVLHNIYALARKALVKK